MELRMARKILQELKEAVRFLSTRKDLGERQLRSSDRDGASAYPSYREDLFIEVCVEDDGYRILVKVGDPDHIYRQHAETSGCYLTRHTTYEYVPHMIAELRDEELLAIYLEVAALAMKLLDKHLPAAEEATVPADS